MSKRGRKPKYIGVDKTINQIYSRKGLSKLCQFQDFKKWYHENHGKCFYCGLTEIDSKILFYNYPKSTRGGKRGKSLELDRKNPILNYHDSLDNFCFSCYWCNNSKTNYFTDEEFKLIGKSIGEVNKERLNKFKL